MFPTGAYAHSFGMEGAVQDGLINDEADFRAFIHDMIIPGLEKLELPTAAAAFAAAQDADLAKLCELDQLYGAMKPSRELREATARTGRQRLSLNLELTGEPFWRDIEQARLAKRLDFGMRLHLCGQRGGNLERAKRERVTDAYNPGLGRVGIGQRRQHGADRLGVGLECHRELGRQDGARRERVSVQRSGIHPGKQPLGGRFGQADTDGVAVRL